MACVVMVLLVSKVQEERERCETFFRPLSPPLVQLSHLSANHAAHHNQLDTCRASYCSLTSSQDRSPLLRPPPSVLHLQPIQRGLFSDGNSCFPALAAAHLLHR